MDYHLNKKINELDDLFFKLFLIAVFFFRIPNFYIFPPIHSAFLTSQAISRLIILFIFLYNIRSHVKTKKRILDTGSNKLALSLILLYFVIQSLSIISTNNTITFLAVYKDLILGMLSLFTFYFYRKQIRLIIMVLIIPLGINFIYQMLLFMNSSLVVRFLEMIIYEKHWKLAFLKLRQEKIYTDVYDEITISLLFLFVNKKLLLRLINVSMAAVFILFFSFLSNVRTRVIMATFSATSTVFITIKNKKKALLLLLFFIFIVVNIVAIVNSSSGRLSFYRRITFQDEYADVKTLFSRIDQIKESISMVRASLFGVGLGNYYDNLPTYKKINRYLLNWRESWHVSSTEFVHNNFASTLAESGHIGFLSFLLLVCYLLISDVFVFKLVGNRQKKAIIISFWTLFIFGFLNPTVSGSYQLLFWGMRGLLLSK